MKTAYNTVILFYGCETTTARETPRALHTKFQTVQWTQCATAVHFHCSLTSDLLMCPFNLGKIFKQHHDSRIITTEFRYMFFNRRPSTRSIYSKQVNHTQPWSNKTSVSKEKVQNQIQQRGERDNIAYLDFANFSNYSMLHGLMRDWAIHFHQ